MKVQINQQTTKKPIPADNYTAILYSIVDLWSHEEEFQWEAKILRKVRLGFELPELQDEYEGVMKPRVIGAELTLSFGDKAKLLQVLTSWLNLTKDKLDWFELKDLIGKPAYLGIVEYTTKKGTSWSKINLNSIVPLPKWLKAPDMFNPAQYFTLEDFDQGVFDTLPWFVKEKIEKSAEYQAIKGTESLTSNIDEDEIPF